MTSRSQYSTYKDADLRHMLNQRHLPFSGNKSELVARLINHDLQHPFPFLKLPGEIRNEIYKYVAASDNTPRKVMIKFTVEDPETPDYVCAGDIKNQSIAPLGLFRSCSQVYHESRAIFYRHHDFKFHIWQGDKGRDKGLLCHLKTMLGMKRHDTCPEKKVFKWLDAIGLDMQKQIRSIEFVIPFYGSARLRPHPSFIDDLHEKLSEYAFVHCSSTEGIHSYHGEVDLWRLEIFPWDPET